MTSADRTHDHADSGEPGDGDLPARSLFRYLGATEWREYRTILAVFAGTFFAEFTPDDVVDLIADSERVDRQTISDRLEQLRRWGNVTVSSSVGNPTSLDDYYRRRNRYLITRAGQEVFETVERLLTTTSEVGEVQAGRLRTLLGALQTIADRLDQAPSGNDDVLSDAIRTAFGEHVEFTTELTQFFAELNQWTSRYDLDADDVQFLAGVLVDYVGEQLTEIERAARPVSRTLERIMPSLDQLVVAARTGLAERVDAAGLSSQVSVRRQPGTSPEDWHHLASWFSSTPGTPARLDQLTRQALAAVRTLTANVTRLSRIGLGATSRRADFIRLAVCWDASASPDESHRIACAAFGLGSVRHFGVAANDANDPVATTTPWADSPRARVPISLRERGDTAQRGRATPIRDRRVEREMLRRSREVERASAERVAGEVIGWFATSAGDRDPLSMPAFGVIRDLVGRATSAGGSAHDERVRCRLRSTPGAVTVIECTEGRLMLRDLAIDVEPIDG